MIKALIFDFDGIIIDSESPELLAWQEIFAAYGRELDLNVWADLVGRPRRGHAVGRIFERHRFVGRNAKLVEHRQIGRRLGLMGFGVFETFGRVKVVQQLQPLQVAAHVIRR